MNLNGHNNDQFVKFQVKAVKPDVLLGLSGVGGIFTKEVCL
jgi:malic enzyme